MAASFCRRSFLHFKNSFFKTQYRCGYVVLIPEAPDDVEENEIFSRTGNMPDFDKVESKHCKNLMVRKAQTYDVGAWELEEQIKIMLKNNEKIDVFKNIFGPLELLSVPFFSTWGLIQTLYHANSFFMPPKMFSPLDLRAQEIRADKLNMELIYKVCKESIETESNKFTEEEKRVVEKFIWNGTINGLDIEEENKSKFKDAMEKLKFRKKSYNDKYLNAMLYFKQIIYDKNVTEVFPSDLLRNSAIEFERFNEGPWIISLKPKIYNRFMEYCDTRQSRLHLWISNRQICSRKGDHSFRADLEVEDIRKIKTEIAQLLGYPTYAHMTMKTRMAESLENVQNTLSELLERAKIGQEAEVYDLEKFANSNNFIGQIEMWDLQFWGRIQKKLVYNFDEIALQEYFPLSQVLLGLFALCEQLFGIIIEEEKQINAWHYDVRYFHVLDEKTKRVLGGFYFDPYARKSKRMSDYEGGLFFPLNSASKICDTLPSASLIFDFSPPTEEKPSLLLFREVEDLFGKFGQVLQHILTETNYSEVGSSFNVEWDSLAVCSRFLRHWLYEPGTLESVSGHYNTGESLPNHILNGVCKMQHHMAGTSLCQEIYLSNLDIELHTNEEYCMPIVHRLWPEHFLFQLSSIDHHPFSLKDIIVDSFGCAYYCRIWSRMIAADVFTAFEETGFQNHEEISALGRRFRSTYFALGGGCHPSEIFRRFRGRNPSITPFLNILGLLDVPAPSLSPSAEPTKIAA